MNGLLYPIREAFSVYLGRWFEEIYIDTPAVQEFSDRTFDRAVMWVPSRMVDSVEDMLKAYQKNDNNSVPGKNALFPIVLIGMAKDYTPSGAETGARQVDRQLVALSQEPGSSVYGYRQAMGDVRVQIVIMASEANSGHSIAAQLGHFIGERRNRKMRAQYRWGQYTLSMPVVFETPDTLFSRAEPENQNMTILIADFTLKITIPMLDAPKAGEENDGSLNDPPGYPVVIQVDVKNVTTGYEATVVPD